MNYSKPATSNWSDLKVFWQMLLDALLQFVWQSSSTQSLSAWKNDLESWSVSTLDISPEEEIFFREQLALCQALVWCAEQIDSQESATNILSLASLKSDQVPPYISERSYWVWDALHCLKNQPLSSRSLSVYVATTDSKFYSLIAELQLAIVSKGSGKLYHHPMDALFTKIHPSFSGALADAWETNVRFSQIEGDMDDIVKWNGRWRLLQPNGEPVLEIEGRSASAAAARGWWFLLNEKIPDDNIIVMAQVDKYGQFTGVGEISKKVTDVIKDGRFDTILVASEENRLEAERVLKLNDKQRFVRVKNLTSSL